MENKVTFVNEKNDDDSKNDKDILEFGSSEIKNKRGNIHCLTIIGQIEGHMLLPPQNKTTKYEHVIPQLISIEEDENTDAVLVVLNTMGGDVEAGLALAEMIASMKKPTVSLVLGGGHSIGVPLAVSADYSFIVPSATMTLHPIRMNGVVIGVPQMFDYFNKMQERVIEFVTRNSKITREKLREFIFNTKDLANDIGTILLGEEAVKCGLIDEVGGVKEALAKLYELIDKHKAEKGAKAKSAKKIATKRAKK